MATETKRATIYFDPSIHQALKFKSIETSRSVSTLVNEAVKAALSEDADDIIFRIRQDNYRIIYSIQDNQLTIGVIKVGHRKEIYR